MAMAERTVKDLLGPVNVRTLDGKAASEPDAKAAAPPEKVENAADGNTKGPSRIAHVEVDPLDLAALGVPRLGFCI